MRIQLLRSMQPCPGSHNMACNVLSLHKAIGLHDWNVQAASLSASRKCWGLGMCKSTACIRHSTLLTASRDSS